MPSPNPGQGKWQADLALATIAFIWGTTFVAVKGALPDVSTTYFVALRFLVAALCMLPILIPVIRTEPHRLWPGLRGGAAAGLFLWAGYLLQTAGLRYTTAGNSGFLTGLYIVLVPLVGAALYRRWPQIRELFGIIVAGAGILVLTMPGMDGNRRLNYGDLLTVGCAVAFAFHIVIVGYFSARERYEAVAVGQVACAAVLSGAAVPFESPYVRWSSPVILALVLTGVFGTAVAFTAQTWAQKYTTATRAALLFALEPVFAVLTAILAGNEQLTVPVILGGTLILSGILVVELRPLRAPDTRHSPELRDSGP